MPTFLCGCLQRKMKCYALMSGQMQRTLVGHQVWILIQIAFTYVAHRHSSKAGSYVGYMAINSVGEMGCE